MAVGNPAEFGKPLTALGQVTNLDLTIPEPKREAAAASVETLGPGQATAGQSAAGRWEGADKLAGIKDTTMSGEMTISRASMKAKQTNRWILTGHFRPGHRAAVRQDGGVLGRQERLGALAAGFDAAGRPYAEAGAGRDVPDLSAAVPERPAGRP